MTIGDYDQVIVLWNAVEGMGMSDADSRDGIGKFLRRNPDMSCVAERAGAIIGAALCGHDGRRGFIYHLAVDRAYRRHGVGRGIIECCLTQLRAQGLGKCHIVVYADNREGKKFWRKTGWELREDLNLMSKILLRPPP